MSLHHYPGPNNEALMMEIADAGNVPLTPELIRGIFFRTEPFLSLMARTAKMPENQRINWGCSTLAGVSILIDEGMPEDEIRLLDSGGNICCRIYNLGG